MPMTNTDKKGAGRAPYERRLYVNISAIQSFPYCNANCDKNGFPKRREYGGDARMYISSQSWKKSSRSCFSISAADNENMYSSTIYEHLCLSLASEAGIPNETAEKYVKKFTKSTKTFGPNGTENNRYCTREQFQELSGFILRSYEASPKKADEELKKAFKKYEACLPTITHILFGRMLNDDDTIMAGYDSPCQIADAFSVNAIRLESDFFTTVADSAADGAKGSAFMGIRIGTSGTLYRYANINLSAGSELFRYEGVNIPEACSEFLKAFVFAVPSGMIHAHGQDTLPTRLLVELRDAPINYGAAYRSAIRAKSEAKAPPGYERQASEALDRYKEDVDSIIGHPICTLDLKDMSLSKMLETLKNEIKGRIN